MLSSSDASLTMLVGSVDFIFVKIAPSVAQLSCRSGVRLKAIFRESFSAKAASPIWPVPVGLPVGVWGKKPPPSPRFPIAARNLSRAGSLGPLVSCIRVLIPLAFFARAIAGTASPPGLLPKAPQFAPPAVGSPFICVINDSSIFLRSSADLSPWNISDNGP